MLRASAAPLIAEWTDLRCLLQPLLAAAVHVAVALLAVTIAAAVALLLTLSVADTVGWLRFFDGCIGRCWSAGRSDEEAAHDWSGVREAALCGGCACPRLLVSALCEVRG